MTMRILARAPMMFIFAIFFAVSINAQLSLVFMVAVPILVLSLALIISTAFPRFRKLQQATDGINKHYKKTLSNSRCHFVRETFEKKNSVKKTLHFRKRALRNVCRIGDQPDHAINHFMQ